MVAIIVAGGVVVCGGGGAIVGGAAAVGTYFLTKSKSPDENNPNVQNARRNETLNEKKARMIGSLSNRVGFAFSTIGGAMTGGACAFSYFEKAWVHGGLRDVSASEVLLDSKVIGSLALGILGLGLIKLGNRLTHYGNTTVQEQIANHRA